MSDLSVLPSNTDSEHGAIISALTGFALGASDDLQALATMAGVDEDTLLEALNDPEIGSELAARLCRIESNGQGAEIRAVQGLNKAIQKITEHIDSGKLPPGILVQAGSFLHKASGLEAKRAQQLKQATAPDVVPFSINIIIPEASERDKTIDITPE